MRQSIESINQSINQSIESRNDFAVSFKIGLPFLISKLSFTSKLNLLENVIKYQKYQNDEKSHSNR